MKPKPDNREFVLAVIAGEIDRVQKMHAAGVSISAPDQFGWLPIHRAAANDRDEIIRLLVQWGSPLEARGTDGWTPLHLASVSRSPRAVSALLQSGADLTSRSESGSTPLHLAIGPTVTEELISTVRVLISAGASVHARDENGRTPLDQAREIEHPELQKIFEDAV